jgi:sulfatase maturation enzyme AslB (radical SAM superfamily)
MGGGEPFYSDNVFWFLNLLDSKIDISNVELWLNTNASIIPKDNIWQLIKKFKVVNIEMSIDAVDEYHEYVRYGSKWSDILSFIKFIKDNKTDNMYLKAHSVYSILNFNVYNKILNFFAENNIEFTYTILQYPKHLSVLNLPKVFRKFYKLEKIDESPYYFTNQDIIRRIKTVFLTKINETIDCDIEYETNGYLKKYLSLMEKENNNSLQDYNPELVKIIDEFNL